MPTWILAPKELLLSGWEVITAEAENAAPLTAPPAQIRIKLQRSGFVDGMTFPPVR